MNNTPLRNYFVTSPAPDARCATVGDKGYTPRELADMEAAGTITSEIMEEMQPLLDRLEASETMAA